MRKDRVIMVGKALYYVINKGDEMAKSLARRKKA